MYQTIKQFYASKQWQQCRESYRKKARGLCERCLAKGIVKEGEEVHHKVRLIKGNINDPQITVNFDNLELLCQDCHHAEHYGEKRYKVDKATGRVVTLD